jgi:hypothetical protein
MAFSHLRPLSLGEMLDGAFTLYRRQFASLFLTALVPQLPAMVMVTLFYGYLGAIAGKGEPGPSTLFGFGIGTLVFAVVWMVGFATTFNAVTFQTARAYTGAPVTTGEALRRGLSRALPLILAIMVVFFLTVLGFCAFIIGAFVVWIACFAVVPAVVLERRGPIEAISRSWQLVKGAWIEVFLATLIAGLIAGIPAWTVQAFSVLGGQLLVGGDDPQAAMVVQAVSQVLGQLASTLTIPFSLGVTVLLYYDRRVRTEALDVQMMAESLTPAPAPPPAPGWG